jgi:hypothetical protein
MGIGENIGRLPAEALWSLYGENQRHGIQEESHLITAFEKSVDFFLRHGLPPIGIVDFDFVSECSELSNFSDGFLGAHQIDRGHAATADGHGFAVLDGFDELGELVLGVGYADFHVFRIAI